MVIAHPCEECKLESRVGWSNHLTFDLQLLHWCFWKLRVQLGGKLPLVAGLQEGLHLFVLGDHGLMVDGHGIIHLVLRGKDVLLKGCPGSVGPKGPWFWDQVEGSRHLLSTGLLCQVLLPGLLDGGLSVQDAGPWAIQVAPLQALFVVRHVQLSEHLGSQGFPVCHTQSSGLHLPQDFCRQCDCFIDLGRVHLWGFDGIAKGCLPQLHRLGRSRMEDLLALVLVLLLLQVWSLIALRQGFQKGRIWGRGHPLLGGLSVQEVAQLFDIFRGKPLTRAGVERALECYILKKRSIEHGKLLSRKFLKPSDKRGLGYGEMQEVDAGAAMEMMCPT